MDSKNAKERALSLFAEKFNCAESVLLGLKQEAGIDMDGIPNIATGFGAGIALHGEACGALVGAVMALGLRFGRSSASDLDAKNLTYSKVKALFEDFKQEFGSVRCIDLTECDMLTPEGLQRSKDLNLHANFCPKFVAFAAEKTAQLMND